MGDLAFTMMDNDYALQDVHTPIVVETFVGKDNMTQHWSGGSWYCRKEGCSKHKKEKRTKATKWSMVLEKEKVFQEIQQRNK